MSTEICILDVPMMFCFADSIFLQKPECIIYNLIVAIRGGTYGSFQQPQVCSTGAEYRK